MPLSQAHLNNPASPWIIGLAEYSRKMPNSYLNEFLFLIRKNKCFLSVEWVQWSHLATKWLSGFIEAYSHIEQSATDIDWLDMDQQQWLDQLWWERALLETHPCHHGCSFHHPLYKPSKGWGQKWADILRMSHSVYYIFECLIHSWSSLLAIKMRHKNLHTFCYVFGSIYMFLPYSCFFCASPTQLGSEVYGFLT